MAVPPIPPIVVVVTLEGDVLVVVEVVLDDVVVDVVVVDVVVLDVVVLVDVVVVGPETTKAPVLSTNVPSLDPTTLPTAAQLVGTGHDTANRESVEAGSWWGNAAIVHVVPSHCSNSSALLKTPLSMMLEVPTATQLVAAPHDMPPKLVVALPAGLGLATIVHPLPSHCSINVVVALAVRLYDSPTAVQLVVATQVTALRVLKSALGMLGLMTIFQAPPSHCSMSDDLPLKTLRLPTAVQLDASVHHTPNSASSAPTSGLEVGTIVHVIPSQCSTREVAAELMVSESPTAVQLETLGHDTAASLLKGAAVFGLGTTVHVIPSQCSTNVAPVPPKFIWESPTAVQLETAGHDTPKSSLSALGGPRPLSATLGLGTIVQAAPSHCSTRVFWRPLRMNVPTAVQVVVATHDTPTSLGSDPSGGLGLGTMVHAVPAELAVAVTALSTRARPSTATPDLVLPRMNPLSPLLTQPQAMGLTEWRNPTRAVEARAPV